MTGHTDHSQETTLNILSTGPLTSIQDIGRFGYQRYGITQSGPMDRMSYELAHRLLGDETSNALIEFAGLGGRFQLSETAGGPVRLAGTGGKFPVTLNGIKKDWWAGYTLYPGDVLDIGYALDGNYGYLALKDGISVEPVMCSCSTHSRAGFGGLDGRLLKAGDRISLTLSNLKKGRSGRDLRLPRTDHELPYTNQGEPGDEIRVIMGQQADRFSSAEQQKFCSQRYIVSAKIDRMGAFLEGEPLKHLGSHDVVSDGIVFGSVQVPGSGLPVVLLADRQPTGGYPKIATIISADIPKFVQLRPGQAFRFRSVSRDHAIDALRRMKRMIKQYEQSFTPVFGVDGNLSERLLTVNLISGAIADSEDLPWQNDSNS